MSRTVIYKYSKTLIKQQKNTRLFSNVRTPNPLIDLFLKLAELQTRKAHAAATPVLQAAPHLVAVSSLSMLDKILLLNPEPVVTSSSSCVIGVSVAAAAVMSLQLLLLLLLLLLRTSSSQPSPLVQHASTTIDSFQSCSSLPWFSLLIIACNLPAIILQLSFEFICWKQSRT